MWRAAVDEVGADAGDAGAGVGGPDWRAEPSLGIRMEPAEEGQPGRVEALDPHAEPADPLGVERPGALLVERGRVALRRDLHLVRRGVRGGEHGAEHPPELGRLPQRGRAPAEEDRRQPLARERPPAPPELGDDGVGVPAMVDLVPRPGERDKVAVRALLQAEREMDVHPDAAAAACAFYVGRSPAAGCSSARSAHGRPTPPLSAQRFLGPLAGPPGIPGLACEPASGSSRARLRARPSSRPACGPAWNSRARLRARLDSRARLRARLEFDELLEQPRRKTVAGGFPGGDSGSRC